MERIFVMSDLHGQGEAFFSLLEQVQFKASDHLFILGDVIDRGPDGIALLQHIQSQSNMTLILGNHEELMLRALEEEPGWFEGWLSNGGVPTFQAYQNLTFKEQQDLLDFLEDCPLYYILEHLGETYLLVHAGLRLIPSLDLNTHLQHQGRDELLWIREDFLRHPSDHLPFTVVHGHTPTCYYPELQALSPTTQGISIEAGRIGIDCGAALNAQLGLYCLTDGSCYYYDFN